MLTVKQLKQFLKGARDDAVITDEHNRNFVHLFMGDNIILSTKHPIGYCKQTGEKVYPTENLKDYTAFCPALNKDLTNDEWSLLDEVDK